MLVARMSGMELVVYVVPTVHLHGGLRSIATWSQLHHPHVLQLYGLYNRSLQEGSPSTLNVVTEVAGHNLAEILASPQHRVYSSLLTLDPLVKLKLLNQLVSTLSTLCSDDCVFLFPCLSSASVWIEKDFRSLKLSCHSSATGEESKCEYNFYRHYDFVYLE